MSRYTILGIVGAAVGAALNVLVGGASLVPGNAILLSIVAPLVGFPIAVKAVHIFVGHERIVLYEQVLMALGSSALALWLFGQAIGLGIELTMLGLCVLLAFGRFGCLQVGCCYGWPTSRGIRYGPEHVAAGFPAGLEGVPIAPIQAVEVFAHLAMAAMGYWLFTQPHQPGELVGLYLACYGPLRFGLEIVRSDGQRPTALEMTEAQWIAVVVGTATLGIGLWTRSIYLPLYLGSAACLYIGAVWVVVARKTGALGELGSRGAHHLNQLAEAVALVAESPGSARPAVADTDNGIRVSFSVDEGGGEHFGLSGTDKALSSPGAAKLAELVHRLRRHRGPVRLLPGKQSGVFHVFLDPASKDQG